VNEAPSHCHSPPLSDDVRTHTRGKPGNPMGVGEEHYHWRRCEYPIGILVAARLIAVFSQGRIIHARFIPLRLRLP
jgi:hypothetical protein